MNVICVCLLLEGTRVVELTPTYTPPPPPGCTTQDSRALSEKGRRVKGVCLSSYGSVDSLETINGPRATTGVEEAVRPSFNMSHQPPHPLRDDRCIDRQHSGNLHGTHSTSTAEKQDLHIDPQDAAAGGSLHSPEFHVSRPQVTISNILRDNTRERTILCDGCGAGSFPGADAKRVWYLSLCVPVRPAGSPLFLRNPKSTPIHPHACAPWLPFPVLFHVDGEEMEMYSTALGDGQKQKEHTNTQQRVKDDYYFDMFFIQFPVLKHLQQKQE
ncbi:hypothetical protein B0T18DRAFT_245617 [Schizothecium vesticola]|uniref:Uncharacterized protein n=1 Tax=Schizothecium vesticola TaxID=314040 RepID=A0AA40BQG7_9PEZI|nr:hypothetical protein B0T18DRAFT_245617 [Schizothecium vesticola]